MMLMLQYPLLPVVSLLCAVLAAAAVMKRSLWLGVCTAVLICGMLVGALACMLPYAELLLLLLPAIIVCLAAVVREGKA